MIVLFTIVPRKLTRLDHDDDEDDDDDDDDEDDEGPRKAGGAATKMGSPRKTRGSRKRKRLTCTDDDKMHEKSFPMIRKTVVMPCIVKRALPKML